MAVAALVSTCETTTAPPSLAVRVVSSNVWSGGEATLISGAFRVAPSLPTGRIGAETLAVRPVNDSTVAVRLPDGNGPVMLVVDVPGFAPDTSALTLHGFDKAEVGPLLSGFLQVVPGQPWVVGAGDPGLVEVDVRANAGLRSWPDTVHSPDCTWGVGPSIRPGHYVLFGKAPGGACTHPWVWRYGAPLERVDSLWAAEDMWSLAEIGPGGIVAGADDALTIAHCDAAGCVPRFYMNQGGALTGVTIGRVAGRAVLHSWFGWLVDAASGDTLRRMSWYTGAPFHHVEGAAFTTGEDTAFVVASQAATWSRLLVVDPASGELLDTLSLPGVQAFDVARDLARPWLHVFVLEGIGLASLVPQLIILDQGTRAPVAGLRAPSSEALSLTQWHQFRIVLDPAMDALYVVATVQVYDAHGIRARILRFRLLP
jgi:hypothetical protein